jgi:hypothetical protein
MTTFNGIAVAAGSKTLVTVELDWNRPNMQKDFSISVWATGNTAVTIRETSIGKSSAKHWLYGDAVPTPTPTPIPIIDPTPTPTPEPEACTASATVFNFGKHATIGNMKAIHLFNGCKTRSASISLTMPSTMWQTHLQTN